MVVTTDVTGELGSLHPVDGEMTEMLLLLPNHQAAALERAARHRGLTSAQLARRLIRAFLETAAADRPTGDGRSRP